MSTLAYVLLVLHSLHIVPVVHHGDLLTYRAGCIAYAMSDDADAVLICDGGHTIIVEGGK
jgi:hypothetical protein